MLPWIEGAAERFICLSIMEVVDDIDPTAFIRRAPTAVLSIPLAPQALRHDDGQGTHGIFLHQGKHNEEKSDRVKAFSCKHVVSENTATDYELRDTGARKQWIRNCGLGRFEKLQEEMHAFIAKKVSQATCLAEQLEGSSVTSGMAKARRETELKKDIGTLEDFLKLLNSTWSETVKYAIGWLEWTPKIRNDVDDRRYTH